MGRASRISAVLCLAVAAIAAACSGEGGTELPLEFEATVTQVIPLDTAMAGDGDAEGDSLRAYGEHDCPSDDGASPPEGGQAGPGCSNDARIH